jgi:hypothetical protein
MTKMTMSEGSMATREQSGEGSGRVTSGCCAVEAQEVCCEPSEKAACCGAARGTSCGCQSQAK